MKNQGFSGIPQSQRFALCPTTVVGGDAVLLGAIPAIALNSYSALTGGADFYLSGSYNLTVVASTSHSPYTGSAVKPGDALYASGTLDSTTNVTTGLLISKTTTDTPFGQLDPSYSTITSATTDTSALVRIGG